jgi:hypothetical protein
MTYEKTADDLELASHLQEQLNLAGRKAAEAALAPQTPKDKDGNHVKVTHCVEEDCGEALAPLRVEMGRTRCTPCQILQDARRKRGLL